MLYGSSSGNGSRNKQVRVVNAKPERNCGKSCVCAYCKKHNYQLKKGMKIPAPCRSCGVGVLCAYRLCLSCGGSALKQPNPQAQKKNKGIFWTCFAPAQVNPIKEITYFVIPTHAMSSVEKTCELSDAIQNLPPELCEIIYKEYIAIKLKQRAALGWDKVHQHFSKVPFCHYKNTRTVVSRVVVLPVFDRSLFFMS